MIASVHNIYVHTRYGKVMRIVPHENTAINQTWISDRDRFSYEGLYHPDRLEKPMVRVEGQWKETDWQTALDIAVALLRSIIAEGADKFSCIGLAKFNTGRILFITEVDASTGFFPY